MKRVSAASWVRFGRLLFVVAIAVIGMLQLQASQSAIDDPTTLPSSGSSPAAQALTTLSVKGRAPKTGYSRAQFSEGWDTAGTCDIRNVILARDMTDVIFVPETCKVASGTLNDPYTGKTISFSRGAGTSTAVQIDHVVALSDAWQKGAQQLTPEKRHLFANDPLNLLAVDGTANQTKGDGDAATWLPTNKPFRCNYVARQIAVKQKYALWVTAAEYRSIANVLAGCPDQTLPTVIMTMPK